MNKTLLSLFGSSLIALPALAVAQTTTVHDWFYNGSERVDLAIDPSAVGVLFAENVDESLARALLLAHAEVDADALARVPFVGNHLRAVPLRSGTTAIQALQLARMLAEQPFVASASPRYLAGIEPYFLTDEILVRWNSGVSEETRRALETSNDLTRVANLEYSSNPGVVYRLPPSSTLAALPITRRLFESGAVEFAIPDFSLVRLPKATTNDPLFPNQWHLESTGQFGAVVDADVDIQGAWDVTRGDPNLIVAVVDTGVELGHPDLVGSLIQGIDVLSNDNNPKAEDINLFFFVLTENHATSVSGIISGPGNNGIGTSGAAQNCKIMPIRFLSESPLGGSPTVQDEADAFNFARANGAAVINNSWGPGGAAPLPASTKIAIDDCVTNGRGGLGTMVFFAAGNESSSVDQNGYAAYANTIAVSASTDQNLFASYSNFGNSLDFAAPSNGGVTTGTWTTDRLGSKGYSSGDYTDAFGGTSSASPLAAGIAALVMSANPNLSWDEVRDVMRTTTDKIDLAGGAYNGNGYSTKYGYGKVNATAAVNEALNRPPHGISFYGSGFAGASTVPSIGATAVPKAGSATFGITLKSAQPNALSYLLIGFAPSNLPIFGGTLLVDIVGPSFILPLAADGVGSLTVPLPIPSTPSPVGVVFDSQWISVNPSAPQGYGLSRGMAATIQP